MRKTIVIAAITALTITAVSVVPTMPILAEKQTPVERVDEPVSVDVLELMSKARDLPLEQFEDLF